MDRRIIVDILLDIEKGMYLSAALDKHMKGESLSRLSRAFITREVKGVIERLLTIDHLISSVSTHPIGKMEPEIRNILRLGIFELVWEDGIPSHAAVNEAVELVKSGKNRRLSGFVNGILRNTDRKKDKLLSELADRPDILYSVPNWMFNLWKVEFGINAAVNMCEASHEERDICIRTNTFAISPEKLKERLEQEGVKAELSGENPLSLMIRETDDEAPALAATESFKKGLFYISDIASQLVVDESGIKEGEKVLDLCASPGGKTVIAAMKTGSGGSVTSCDVNEKKTARIKENVERLGFENVKVLINDATRLNDDFIDRFDAVIADLPCSGLGVISHKPDIRYRVKNTDIMTLAMLQRDILVNAARYVKKGGRLIFSTCTVDKTENEKNAEWFLSEHKDFECVRSRQRFITAEHDGFFTAEFIKK